MITITIVADETVEEGKIQIIPPQKTQAYFKIPLTDNSYLFWDSNSFYLYRDASKIRQLTQFEEEFVWAAYHEGKRSK